MDETESDDVVTVGQRLREAREAKGLSVEDIAAQTRIPTRHLLSLETSEWDKLPAATYSVGFAKNYAGAIGLDRDEIGEQLRAEMGGTRSAAAMHPEIYEAVDPARTMPRGLVIAALGLLAVVVLAFTWLNNRSLEADEPVAEAANVATPAPVTAAPAPAQPPITAQVVLTASEPVWIQVKDGGTTLHEAELAAGQSFTVPASAVAPVLTTGKPEALRIMVGTTQAPPVGEPGRTVSGVSLRAADLLRTASAAAPPRAAQQVPPAAPQPAPRPRSRPAPPPAETADPAVPSEVNSVAPGTSGQTATQ